MNTIKLWVVNGRALPLHLGADAMAANLAIAVGRRNQHHTGGETCLCHNIFVENGVNLTFDAQDSWRGQRGDCAEFSMKV